MRYNDSRNYAYVILCCVIVALCFSPISGCTRKSCPAPYSYHQSPPPAATPSTPPPLGQPPALNRKGTTVLQQKLAKIDTPGDVTHEVGPLETIWRLSKMYGVPMDDIYAANGLRPGDTIKNGQKLIIPNARAIKHVVTLYPGNNWKYIIIHHTGTEIGNANIIHRSHGDRGFWQGLGYHFLIDNGTLGKGDGQIEMSPRWIKQQSGAHCKAGGMNETGIGVALVGNFNQEPPTARQIESLNYLLRMLSNYYHISSSNIMGHRDVPGANTDCPGRRFPWPVIRQALSKY